LAQPQQALSYDYGQQQQQQQPGIGDVNSAMFFGASQQQFTIPPPPNRALPLPSAATVPSSAPPVAIGIVSRPLPPYQLQQPQFV
jgi:hypothetical protein